MMQIRKVFEISEKDWPLLNFYMQQHSLHNLWVHTWLLQANEKHQHHLVFPRNMKKNSVQQHKKRKNVLLTEYAKLLLKERIFESEMLDETDDKYIRKYKNHILITNSKLELLQKIVPLNWRYFSADNRQFQQNIMSK